MKHEPGADWQVAVATLQEEILLCNSRKTSSSSKSSECHRNKRHTLLPVGICLQAELPIWQFRGHKVPELMTTMLCTDPIAGNNLVSNVIRATEWVPVVVHCWVIFGKASLFCEVLIPWSLMRSAHAACYTMSISMSMSILCISQLIDGLTEWSQ